MNTEESTFGPIDILSYALSLSTTALVLYVTLGGDPTSMFRKVRSLMESPHYGCQSRREEEVEEAYQRGYKNGSKDMYDVAIKGEEYNAET